MTSAATEAERQEGDRMFYTNSQCNVLQHKRNRSQNHHNKRNSLRNKLQNSVTPNSDVTQKTSHVTVSKIHVTAKKLDESKCNRLSYSSYSTYTIIIVVVVIVLVYVDVYRGKGNSVTFFDYASEPEK